jgi:hypothetical protein
MKPPKIRPHLVPILSPEELEMLLKAARGKGFQNRRDMATISLFKDTGIRLSELAGLELTDIDVKRRGPWSPARVGRCAPSGSPPSPPQLWASTSRSAASTATPRARCCGSASAAREP